jgi:hypothetical protein
MASDFEKPYLSFLHLEREPTPPSDTPAEENLTGTTVLYRVGLFCILEGGFLLLSAIALVHPIILHLPSDYSLPEVKGGFTVFFIAWHALAVAVAKDIPLYVFSAEWLAQYERTGRLESRETDRVSKLTTGVIGQTRHFFSCRATMRYRIAMVLTLLLMSVGGLGPSTSAVTDVLVDAEIDISLANLTFPYDYNSTDNSLLDNTWIIETRANSILRLELFENVTFGFDTEQNLMIAWPSKNFESSDSAIMYRSDVLSFDFNCTWYKPTIWKVEAPNIFWKLWDDKIFISQNDSQGKCFHFQPLSSSSLQATAFVPIATWPTTHFASSWIFAQYPPNPSEPPSPPLLLTGLPTTPSSELAPKLINLTSIGFPTPDAVTALVCDPQFTVYPAQVTLNQGILHAEQLEGHVPVGNVATNPMLRDQFLASLIPDLTCNFPDSIYGISSDTFSSVARLLLFCDENNPCDTVFKPFPLPTINKNMNQFFRSASKAFLDGYNGTRPGVDTLSVPNFNTFWTKGIGQVDKMALVTSKTFFIAFCVILAVIAAFLTLLCLVIRQERLMCFNLDNVSRSLIDELEKGGSIITRSPVSSTSSASASASSLTLFNLDYGAGLRRCRTCSQNL